MGDPLPMRAKQLKRLIEAGAYSPDPSLVAVAVLRRPAIRDLLLPGFAPVPAVGARGATPGRR